MKKILLFIALAGCGTAAFSQTYNLPQLLKDNKLAVTGKATVVENTDKPAIHVEGVTWITGVEFTTGTIDIDLRGRDVFQKSFIGVAFHALDTGVYDMVYFRPFNFQATDPERKVHAVQYTSHPDYPWFKLREEHHNEYEKGITPAPDPKEWFHARIEVKADGTVNVFVNNATQPSLTVKKLNKRMSGKIGLSEEFIGGDFANLVIKKN
jgi:hypothetical protein